MATNKINSFNSAFDSEHGLFDLLSQFVLRLCIFLDRQHFSEHIVIHYPIFSP